MLGLNYLAIVAAAVAAFVASSAWYVVAQRVSPGTMAALVGAPAWKMPIEPFRNIVLAFVIAHLLVLARVTDWTAAAYVSLWLWVGFPVMLLSGSVIWENVPWKRATIHAGDWLLKLLLMAVVLGAWR
jgi:hypothetical protein